MELKVCVEGIVSFLGFKKSALAVLNAGKG
jgi:hypothetical protein